ncbi:hypothetical protein F2P81_002478 [Scophthalmus maximus]|uniref:Uncharacterized protein n=1 Tax=Scophthalmus maximus TaxID=52904 RepID=A0A6A4TM87_SCOMX|nr:hypothetical protein F2P81_002478 [Scophthalmus maximus]
MSPRARRGNGESIVQFHNLIMEQTSDLDTPDIKYCIRGMVEHKMRLGAFNSVSNCCLGTCESWESCTAANYRKTKQQKTMSYNVELE